MHVRRFRGGDVEARVQLLPLNTRADGCDNAHALVSRTVSPTYGQDRFQQCTGGRLAIGPSDAQDCHRPAGVAVQGRAELGQGQTPVAVLQIGQTRRQGNPPLDQLVRGVCASDGAGSSSDGVGDKAMAVYAQTGDGHKECARSGLSAIRSDRADFQRGNVYALSVV